MIAQTYVASQDWVRILKDGFPIFLDFMLEHCLVSVNICVCLCL